MNFNIATYKYILVIIILFTTFNACKKDSRSDLDKVAASTSGILASYVENGQAVNLSGQIYNFTPYFIGIPIKLNKSAEAFDTVFATVDTSLVTSYNQLYGESNAAIPGGAFGASNNGIFPLSAGAAQAGDSLYAVLKDASQLVDSAIYLVPVRLKEKKSAGLQTSIVFFKMQVTKVSLFAEIDATASYPDAGVPSLYNGGYFFSYFYSNGVSAIRDKYKIGVRLTAAFPAHDLKVSAQLYNDTATIYSVGSYYLPFPANTFSMANSTVTIPAGSLYAKDSLEIDIQNKDQFLLDNSYLLVLKLQQSTDPAYSVPLLTGNSAAYMYMYAY